MKKNKNILLVFVHGWSVTHTDTYGQLPERLKSEATAKGLKLTVKEIFLGRYISFHDEVKLADIARAFDAAVTEQLAPLVKNKTRFVCITHSTGGPVIRDWWHRYYLTNKTESICPMSHLIMLAPANYGSALAQLGKGRLSRMKFWFGGVEPGQGVLDWLALGSQQAWALNLSWIKSDGHQISETGVFPFVLTGQTIDRSFYDHLNTYTGESGSDGVVRVAAANLQANYIQLIQQLPEANNDKKTQNLQPWIAPKLKLAQFKQAPNSALKIVQSKSHSGKDLGIMRSVKKSQTDKPSAALVESILACIKVNHPTDYQQLSNDFDKQSEQTQAQEKIERVENLLLNDSRFIHDRYSMVIFKICDHQGHPVNDFDLILTAGKDNDPNRLPAGFFVDRQRNSANPNTICFYFDYDLMVGSDAIVDDDNKVLREQTLGIERLGMKVVPRPDSGFVHYLPCEVNASRQLLQKTLQPNRTTLVDICLQRVVSSSVMQLDKGTKARSFAKQKAEGGVVE